METIEQVITNSRPYRPCPPETWAYVERLAKEQGIKDFGKQKPRPEIREPDAEDEAFAEYILEHFTAEP